MFARLLMAAICLSLTLSAISLAEKPSFWVDIKTGPSTLGGSLQASADLQTGPHLIKARYTWTGKLLDYGIAGGNQTDRAYELGLLYGLATRRDKVSFSVAAGLAYTNVRDYYTIALDAEQFDVSVSRHRGIGFPAELGFTYRFSPFVAFGSSLFANFNKQESIAGMNFGLQFGALGTVNR